MYLYALQNKSLFRRPGTKHFQLVHRSQRDPLIHDPTASDHVLKLVDGPQQSKSKYHGAQPSRDQEEQEDEEAGEGTLAAQLGDAAAYGVYFDDHEYDYMQHLRPVGAGGSSFLVETPSSSSGPGVKGKGKAKARPTDFSMKDDMPEDALPSHPLDELSYTDITSAQAPTGGLQPDLDPSVREVLEALDDDAYAVDDGLGSDGEDEFWGSIVKSGERGEHEKVDWVTEEEEGVEKSGAAKEEWAQVAKFKKDAIREAKEDDEDGSEREWGSDEEIDSGDDTIAELVKSSARRPPRKPSASQSGSQFSMTSSAMFRNEQLRTLDDRFDEVRLTSLFFLRSLNTDKSGRHRRWRNFTKTIQTQVGEAILPTKMMRTTLRLTLHFAVISTKSWTTSFLDSKSSVGKCVQFSKELLEWTLHLENLIGLDASWPVLNLDKRKMGKKLKLLLGDEKRREFWRLLRDRLGRKKNGVREEKEEWRTLMMILERRRGTINGTARQF